MARSENAEAEGGQLRIRANRNRQAVKQRLNWREDRTATGEGKWNKGADIRSLSSREKALDLFQR